MFGSINLDLNSIMNALVVPYSNRLYLKQILISTLDVPNDSTVLTFRRRRSRSMMTAKPPISIRKGQILTSPSRTQACPGMSTHPHRDMQPLARRAMLRTHMRVCKPGENSRQEMHLWMVWRVLRRAVKQPAVATASKSAMDSRYLG